MTSWYIQRLAPHWDMNDEIRAVCHRTGTAEYRNWFTSAGWFNIGAILSERGFSVYEIECILRSELMWDAIPSGKQWGHCNSADFERKHGEIMVSPEVFRESVDNEMLDKIEELEREDQ